MCCNRNNFVNNGCFRNCRNSCWNHWWWQNCSCRENRDWGCQNNGNCGCRENRNAGSGSCECRESRDCGCGETEIVRSGNCECRNHAIAGSCGLAGNGGCRMEIFCNGQWWTVCCQAGRCGRQTE